MSILINLLPDIRQAKLKERRRRQLVSGVSVMVWVVCGAIVLLLSVYTAGQKVAIKVLSNSISQKKTELQNVTGLTDALTAQQHLASLGGLYEKRVYMTKFFKAYSEADPTQVTINSLALDAQNAMIVNGNGTSYAAVAKLARALEASNVKVGTGAAESNSPYFTNVTIKNVSSTASGVSFTLDATIDTEVTSGK
jgi:Tfp pilus assembly protein PilN